MIDLLRAISERPATEPTARGYLQLFLFFSGSSREHETSAVVILTGNCYGALVRYNYIVVGRGAFCVSVFNAAELSVFNGTDFPYKIKYLLFHAVRRAVNVLNN